MTNPINIPAALGLPPLPSSSPDTISALMWARETLQQQSKTMYGVSDPNGIEELKSVNIGGVEQWLHIRGRNRNNPVILWLHGGPGAPVIGGGFDAVHRPWEDYFTVVMWDQRQTGKSYYPADDEANPLTVKQFEEDTEELIQYLRSYLEKDKLVIVGASWGTSLGMKMVKRHPEWIHAYVGVGQVVNAMDNERVVYERILHHAKQQNNRELIDQLESQPKLWETESPEREQAFMAFCDPSRQALSELGRDAIMRHMSIEDASKVVSLERLISPHLTLTDISNTLFGGKIALLRDPNFAKQFLDIDLPKELGCSFDVPIFFFSGRHDWQTPTTLSDQWFEQIDAPHKELIHFEESSHWICNEEPGKFLVSLVNRVLPFASNKTGKE